MTPYWKLMVLKSLLPAMLEVAGVTAPVFISVKSGSPEGPQLHAWTYPADVYGEGVAGTIGIAIREKSLKNEGLAFLIERVLAHEVAHAKFDMDLIRRGGKTGELEERRADAYALWLVEGRE